MSHRRLDDDDLDTSPAQLTRNSPRVTRVIDFKVPLPWLMSSAVTIILALAGMWFKLDRLGIDMSELQSTVKAGNTQNMTMAGQIAILQYRIEALEKDEKKQPGYVQPSRSGR